MSRGPRVMVEYMYHFGTGDGFPLSTSASTIFSISSKVVESFKEMSWRFMHGERSSFKAKARYFDDIALMRMIVDCPLFRLRLSEFDSCQWWLPPVRFDSPEGRVKQHDTCGYDRGGRVRIRMRQHKHGESRSMDTDWPKYGPHWEDRIRRKPHSHRSFQYSAANVLTGVRRWRITVSYCEGTRT